MTTELNDVPEEEIRAAIAVHRFLAEHYGKVAEALTQENMALHADSARMRAMSLEMARLSLECGALKTELATIRQQQR